MKYLFPINAIHRDGHTKLLYSVKEVLEFVETTRVSRWGRYSVGAEWNDVRNAYGEYIWSWDRPYTISNDWILRDDRGRPVDHREFQPTKGNWKRRRRHRKGKHTFRQGPVPGVTHCSGGWKCDAPRKKNGGRGVLRKVEIHKAEFEGRRAKNDFD